MSHVALRKILLHPSPTPCSHLHRPISGTDSILTPSRLTASTALMADSTPGIATTMAPAHVFGIAELVEAILLNLSPREVFAVARVNRNCNRALDCQRPRRHLGLVHLPAEINLECLTGLDSEHFAAINHQQPRDTVRQSCPARCSICSLAPCGTIARFIFKVEHARACATAADGLDLYLDFGPFETKQLFIAKDTWQMKFYMSLTSYPALPPSELEIGIGRNGHLVKGPTAEGPSWRHLKLLKAPLHVTFHITVECPLPLFSPDPGPNSTYPGSETIQCAFTAEEATCGNICDFLRAVAAERHCLSQENRKQGNPKKGNRKQGHRKRTRDARLAKEEEACLEDPGKRRKLASAQRKEALEAKKKSGS